MSNAEDRVFDDVLDDEWTAEKCANGAGFTRKGEDNCVEIWSLIRQLESRIERIPTNRKTENAMTRLDECRMWLESLESDEWEPDDDEDSLTSSPGL
jgi:hypothetical protein